MTPPLQATLAAVVRYIEALNRNDEVTLLLLHDLRNSQMLFHYGATPVYPAKGSLR